MRGYVQWRRNTDGTPTSNPKIPLFTWADKRIAMEDQYLSMEALPRTVASLVSLKQGVNKTVERLRDRQRHLFDTFDCQVERSGVSQRVALENALFESARPAVFDK